MIKGCLGLKYLFILILFLCFYKWWVVCIINYLFNMYIFFFSLNINGKIVKLK